VIVPGKITDPVVGVIGSNIYTKALDEGTELTVIAKPTLRDGAINRLFISDITS
jgi:hypothetical protein